MLNNIRQGVFAILDLQGSDGGIPATSVDALSGCWTTADFLESTLTSKFLCDIPLSKVFGLINFLLDSQFKRSPEGVEAGNIGAWPIFRHDAQQIPSTMATGHAVSALVMSRKFVDIDPISQLIDSAITDGIAWLQSTQKEDGSWATQPHDGKQGGESAIIAILYALRSFSALGHNYKNSSNVRKAVDYLYRVQNSDGSWSGRVGHNGDPTNTARAMAAVFDSCNIRKSAVKKAVKYLKKSESEGKGLWEIESERFDIDNAPAQVVYNKNVNCDILTALVLFDEEKKLQKRLVDFLLNSQAEDGLWCLASPSKTIEEIVTWSTAEWIRAMSLFNASIDSGIREHNKFYKYATYTLLGVGYSGLVLQYHQVIVRWVQLVWGSIPASYRTFLISTVLLAILLGVCTNFLTDYIKSKLNKDR